jgi:hypothetical protein
LMPAAGVWFSDVALATDRTHVYVVNRDLGDGDLIPDLFGGDGGNDASAFRIVAKTGGTITELADDWVYRIAGDGSAVYGLRFRSGADDIVRLNGSDPPTSLGPTPAATYGLTAGFGHVYAHTHDGLWRIDVEGAQPAEQVFAQPPHDVVLDNRALYVQYSRDSYCELLRSDGAAEQCLLRGGTEAREIEVVGDQVYYTVLASQHELHAVPIP